MAKVQDTAVKVSTRRKREGALQSLARRAIEGGNVPHLSHRIQLQQAIWLHRWRSIHALTMAAQAVFPRVVLGEPVAHPPADGISALKCGFVHACMHVQQHAGSSSPRGSPFPAVPRSQVQHRKRSAGGGILGQGQRAGLLSTACHSTGRSTCQRAAISGTVPCTSPLHHSWQSKVFSFSEQFVPGFQPFSHSSNARQ